MSAHVVPLPTDPVATPTARAKLLEDRLRAARQELLGALRARGVVREYMGVPPQNEIERLWSDFEKHEFGVSRYWETRCAKLETQLRRTLAADGLDDDQRRQILMTCYGPSGVGRNPGLYTDAEKQLLSDWRQLADRSRSAVRVLIHELVAVGR